VILAYVGPETFVPMTSVIAAVAGLFLVVGQTALRRVVGGFQGAFRAVWRLCRPCGHRRPTGSTD
jgi:hypothetical protein